MRTAAGAAGGDEIVHAAGEIAKQNVELYEANSVLLIHQTGRGVAGIGAVRQRALLAAVAAGDIDIAVLGIGGSRRLIRLCGVARCAGIDNDRSSCGCIDLPVGAGDLRI